MGGAADKPSDLDFDALLRSTAVETYGRNDINEILLGDMAQGLAEVSNLDSLPSSVVLGNTIAPEFRDIALGDVLEAVVAQQIHADEQQPVQSTLNVAQCMDIWAREMQMSTQRSHTNGRPVIMSGSVLPLRTDSPVHDQTMAEPATTTTTTTTTSTRGQAAGTARRRPSKKKKSGDDVSQDTSSKGRKATKDDKRSVRNRESAAKSRKKRQQYTNELEERVQMLKDTNKELRKKIISAAKAPPDPYAGTLDGKRLRRTRTMPL